MQKIWVLLKIFQNFLMQLLEDFDIAVALRLYNVALLAYNEALYLPAGRQERSKRLISR